MNKFIKFIQKQKPINQFFIIGIVILLIYIVYTLVSTSTKEPQIPTETTDNLQVSPSTVQPPAQSQVHPFPTPKLSIINSKLNKEPETKETMYEYLNIAPLSAQATQNTLPLALGFISSDKIKSDDSNLLFWSNENKTLAIKIQEDTIIFSNNTTPPTTGQNFTKETSFSIGRQLITELFGNAVGSSLVNQDVAYYKTSRIYASPVQNANQADLVRVSFYQSIEQYPVVALSETGAVFTLYIDHKFNLHSMSVIGGYRTISKINELNITPFSEAIKQDDSVIRINASPDLSSNFDTASNEEISFTNTESRVAYMLINNRFAPVYLLSGVLTGKSMPNQNGLYVLPAAKTN